MATQILEPPETFWMICNPCRARHPPRKRYRKLAEAIADQQALAKEHPGQRFFLLQAMTLEIRGKTADDASEEAVMEPQLEAATA